MRYTDRVIVFSTALITATAAVACNDLFAPHKVRPTSAAHAAVKQRVMIPYEFACTGHRRTKRVTCARIQDKRPIIGQRYTPQIPHRVSSKAIRKDQVIGGNQGEYITLGLANFAWDSISNIFSFDATVQNNLRQPMGTIDGTTVTGVKVFFYSGPTCTGGPCYVTNADGTGTFTADSQAYFLYNQILQPQDVSTSRNWQIFLAPAVETFDFEIEAYAAFPAEATTPALAPSSVPDSLYAVTNRVTSDTAFPAWYLNNIIEVEYTGGTSVGDRALAVAKVGGLVVGGASILGDGVYYLQVPVTGYTALTTLIATLDSLPQVDYASVSVFTDSTYALDYRHPVDGDSAKTWHVWPSQSSGTQWAREHVAAPLAWGCDTGDAHTQIAIIDDGFMNLADITANVHFPVVDSHRNNVGYLPTTTGNRHGTAVASIAAARGNNDTGTTGIMWNADMKLYTRHITPSDPNETSINDLTILVNAATDSARVISISGGIGFPRGLHSSADDSARIWNWIAQERDFWVRTVHRLDSALRANSLPVPLIVLAAGNDGQDAYWNTYPAIRDSASIANQVMVVAASDSLDHRWASGTGDTSDLGPRVNIVAPGQRVDALNRDGGEAPFAGTSAATPLVAGAAGLLFSFNPALQASDVQQLLVGGATNGNRRTQDTTILNVYESLKLAAQRANAPLCGNRVWSSGGAIYAQLAGSSTEQLFATSMSAWNVIPMHGGHRIEYTTDSGRYSVRFNGTAWGTPVQVQDANTAVAVSPGYSDNPNAQSSGGLPVANADTTASDSLLAGAARSLYGLNHDGDSAIGAIVNTHADSGTSTHMDTVVIIRGPTQVVFGDSSGSVDTVGTIAYASPTFALGSCRVVVGPPAFCSGYTVLSAGVNLVQLAYAPRGDRVLVAINHDVYSEATTSTDFITDTSPSTGRFVSILPFVSHLVSGTTEAYQFSLPSKTKSQFSTLPTGKDIWWWGISEADSTIMAATGPRNYWLNLDNTLTYTAGDSGTGCAVEYRDGAFDATPLLTVSTNDACVTRIGAQGLQVVYGAGGISPGRTGHAPPPIAIRRSGGVGISSKPRRPTKARVP
jgi:hypothetical protein